MTIPQSPAERADAKRWMQIADQRAIEVAELKVELQRLRSAQPAPQVPSGFQADIDTAARWRPIATAPKDGSVVLLWLGSPWSEPRTAYWYEPWANWQPQGVRPDPNEDASGIGGAVPTHWQPLPPAPKE